MSDSAKEERRGGSHINMCMIQPSAVIHFADTLFVPPEIEATSYIVEFGHRVTWIVSSSIVTEPTETSRGKTRIFFVPSKRSKGPIGVSRQVVEELKKAKFVLSLFRIREYNIVFVRNDVLPGQLFAGPTAVYLKWRHHIPLVFQVENPIEQNRESRRNATRKEMLISRTISGIEGVLYTFLGNRADLLLPISEPMKSYLVRRGIDASKILTLPMGVGLQRFSARSGEKVKMKYGLEDKNTIVYVGTMDLARNLRMLINSFAEARKTVDAKLLMVGDGNDRENLQRLARELGVSEDVIFSGWVPQDRVPDFIAAADVGICPVPPLDFYMVSSPVKMLEYMAMSKPVIANGEIPEHRKVIEESHGGVLVEYGIEQFAEAMSGLIKDPKRSQELGLNGRDWIVRHRSYEVLGREFETRCQVVLEQYSGNRSHP